MQKLLPVYKNQLAVILDNISKARKNCGFKQTDIAKALNISHNSYNRKETGKVGLTVTEFFIIAEILDVDPVQLVGPSPMKVANGK